MPDWNVMPQKRKHKPSSRRPVLRKHISQASITRQTVKRYLYAMNSFYDWCRAEGLCANPKFSEFDMQLGAYYFFVSERYVPVPRYELHCRF